MSSQFDTIILGAGAAGLFCARFAAAKGAKVLILDHAKRPAEKVRISGGGRCNFTNYDIQPHKFLSQNPHFAKSPLSRFTQWDFIELLDSHKITWHEKTLGQLFCDGKSAAIIDMLLQEAKAAELRLSTGVENIAQRDGQYVLTLSTGETVSARDLVVATGGKSIPKMGATGLGYQIAEQFGHRVIDTRPALVPLTFAPHELDWIAPLSGTSLPTTVSANGTAFDEGLLFTHRGLSGPSILQISSYWREGDEIAVNLLPGGDLFDALKSERQSNGRQQMPRALSSVLPSKVAHTISERLGLSGNLADHSDAKLKEIAHTLHALPLKPTGSEGYRTAEVTLGGVDTDEINAKDMQSRLAPNLYFIGEVVDVTGWLGGYNFQWAWASAAATGRAIADK